MTDQRQPDKQPEKPSTGAPESVNKEAAQPPKPEDASKAAPPPASDAAAQSPSQPASSEAAKPSSPTSAPSSPPAKPAEPAAKPEPTAPPASNAMSQATTPAMPNPATEHGPTRDLSTIAREAGVLLSPPSATQRPPMNKEDTLIPESKSEAPPAAKPPEPAKPAAAPTLSNQQVCPTCGHRNRPGVLICENCGTSLVGKQTVMGTRDLIREQETSKEDQKLDAAAVKAVESAGTSIFTEDMVLRIEIEGGSTPMLVYPKQEIIMGRRDPTTGGMPDVDLTAYAGYRMGVSRRHAAVRLQDKQLHLSDLGSSNGTFINGARLIAHRPYQLRDGDEIRLGQMVLRIFFQSNKDRK